MTERIPAPWSLEIEVENVSVEVFKMLTGMTPAEAQRAAQDAVVKEQVANERAIETNVAMVAAKVGIGYAVITEYDAKRMRYATSYFLSELVPATESYQFTSWHSFEAWKARQIG